MKGTVSTIVKKALKDNVARKELRRVIAEGTDGFVTIEGEKYRIVSTSSNNHKKEVNEKRMQHS
jgi:hypothetical protein